MRITLDTNVLIAAFIARGACHELLEHCVRHHHVVTSEFILGELYDKLSGKFYMEDAEDAVALLRRRFTCVEPAPMDKPVSRDPDDDNVLATAQAGECACLVTGDADLLVLESYRGIRILKPQDFWAFEALGNM